MIATLLSKEKPPHRLPFGFAMYMCTIRRRIAYLDAGTPTVGMSITCADSCGSMWTAYLDDAFPRLVHGYLQCL